MTIKYILPLLSYILLIAVCDGFSIGEFWTFPIAFTLGSTTCLYWVLLSED